MQPESRSHLWLLRVRDPDADADAIRDFDGHADGDPNGYAYGDPDFMPR